MSEFPGLSSSGGNPSNPNMLVDDSDILGFTTPGGVGVGSGTNAPYITFTSDGDMLALLTRIGRRPLRIQGEGAEQQLWPSDIKIVDNQPK